MKGRRFVGKAGKFKPQSKIPDAVRKLPQALLFLLSGGALFATALLAPNALRAFEPFFRTNQGAKKRELLQQAVRRLQRRRLVTIEYQGDVAILSITEYGRKRVKRFEFDNLQIGRPERWDGTWRLVLFDIPEQFKEARNALRHKLVDLGFFQMQKSAWVFPYPCRDEIDFVCDFFQVRRFVQCLEVQGLDSQEVRVRSFFRLLDHS